jgi:hypothetical protein
MMNEKKNRKQVNIERNLRREMREDFRNVEFNTYSRCRELGILGSKKKDQL